MAFKENQLVWIYASYSGIDVKTKGIVKTVLPDSLVVLRLDCHQKVIIDGNGSRKKDKKSWWLEKRND